MLSTVCTLPLLISANCRGEKKEKIKERYSRKSIAMERPLQLPVLRSLVKLGSHGLIKAETISC